ncbi:hypothetical protein, partial [Agrobacterium vitis]|uniref:hypothetical protein n=1 Tax=Agrobacterium vitis TaxID=373 RepID=UPI001AEEC7D3
TPLILLGGSLEKPNFWVTGGGDVGVGGEAPLFPARVFYSQCKAGKKKRPPAPATATAPPGMRHTAGATLPAYTAAAAAEELTEGDRR